MKIFIAAMSFVLLLLPHGVESLTCYECSESSSWSQCTSRQKMKYCDSGWRCVMVKEKSLGMSSYYYRRTCSEASVCDDFCKDKPDCVYSCCNSDLCNLNEV